jgi:FlaA1/EpsC-like NDP-sugar epimerase
VPYRHALIVAAHLGLVAIAYLGAYALRFDFAIPAEEFRRFLVTLPYLLVLRMALFHRFGVFRGYWHHVGLRDLLYLVGAVTLGSLGFVGLLAFLERLDGMPAVVPLLDWMLMIMIGGGVRFVARCIREEPYRWPKPHRKRTLIIGAGGAGEQLLRQVLHDPRHPLNVVGVIDDDPAKQGRSLHGVPVLGGTDDLRRFVAMYHAAQLVLAIPSATPDQNRRLIARCAETGIPIKTLPPMLDLPSATVRLSQCRDVQIEDLLGREPVQLDLQAVAPDLAGKVVLVTGAGGSIGSELVRQIARFHPRRLILLERAESPLFFIHREVTEANPETDVVPVLASVTNAARLDDLFETYHPDSVFHAAAYKHVPLLEWNMIEGVWNNVVGTLRLAQCAARYGAKKFVLISTDKAVNPTSILGATKRVAERIVRELPSLHSSATDFRVVRFGNVLGSDGSVVPLFKRQIANGGPLTVTHPEMRRFVMTISEAAQLVLEAAALPEAAGRIAVLEMGTEVRILELAEQMIRLSGLVPHHDVQIVFTGLRPGEKLNEELLAPGETGITTSIEKIRVVEGTDSGGSALARRLRYLIAVTERGDDRAVVRALSAIVSEFQPEPVELAGKRNGRNGHRNGHRNGKPTRITAIARTPVIPAAALPERTELRG